MGEEANNQLNAIPDPKAKSKAKPDKKGAVSESPEPPVGPVLELNIGEEFPQVTLRLQTAKQAVATGESGRRFRVTMYRERMKSPAAGDEQGEVLQIPVRFGDLRPATFVDPIEAELPPLVPEKAAPAKKGKEAAPPPPDEDAKPPYEGEEAFEDQLNAEGEQLLGGGDAWRLPAHLKEAIYYIKVEDKTVFESDTPLPFRPLETLYMPIKVKLAAG